VKIDFFDLYTETNETIMKEIYIERDCINAGVIPPKLDQNLNRYAAAKAIIEAIELSNKLQFIEAQKILKESVSAISSSPSGGNQFCQLLIEDLEECNRGMNDLISFQKGIHSAHAFASMYFSERSAGVIYALRKNLLGNNHLLASENGYGYLTDEQIKGFCRAYDHCSQFLDQYRQTINC